MKISTSQRVQLGWQSKLAAITVAGLLLEAITGIWTYFLAFSVSSQIVVILHVVAGCAITVPLLIYIVSHVKKWADQRTTATAMMGYGTGFLVILAVATGIITTVQAAWTTRVDDQIAFIHLTTGFAIAPLILLHLLFAVRRRINQFESDKALLGARKSFALRVGAWTTVTLIPVIFALTQISPPVLFLDTPTDYEHADQYGQEAGLFAPSYARTRENKLIQPQVLARSESCGTSKCHQQILAEWEPSAHRFSAMNQPFQAVQDMFAEDRSAAETRYCAGCHDPISLFAGTKSSESKDLSAPGFKEGASCVACHSIAEVDQRGNGDYLLQAPEPYLWEDASGSKRWISEFLIRAFPRKHRADYDRSVAKTPEYCGSCHKQFIPEELNRFGISPGQNQFDEWARSHWHNEDPDIDLTCTDCHMRLVTDSKDPGRGEASDVQRGDDGAHRHHGFIATNSFMPDVLKLPQYQAHVRLTNEWLKGETLIPEIADRWPTGPVAGVEIVAPEEIGRGEPLRFSVLVNNRKAGHSLTTGPLDFVRTWLFVQVLDQDEQVIDEWGALDPVTRRIMDHGDVEHKTGNARDEGTMVLEATPLDEFGQPLLQHELWRKAGGEGQRVIFPGYADRQVYKTLLPADLKGPLTIRAELKFRRYRQEFLDLVVPDMEEESGVFQPAVIQSTAELSVPLNVEMPVNSSGGVP